MSTEKYLDAVEGIVNRIRTTQIDNIRAASDIATHSIAGGGLVHLFGAGHAHLPVEETYPRIGSYAGFHPLLEHSLAYFTNVVGDMGTRQFLFLERVEGFGKVIMRNYHFQPQDSMIIFSHSGVNQVIIDVALETKAQGMPLIGVTSAAGQASATPRHSSGKRLCDLADIVIDNGVPLEDAMVSIDGLPFKVAAGSTIGFVTVINSIVAQVAENLMKSGVTPIVHPSHNALGPQVATEQLELAFAEYARRLAHLYS